MSPVAELTAAILGVGELAKAAMQMSMIFAQHAGMSEEEKDKLYQDVKVEMAARPSSGLNEV